MRLNLFLLMNFFLSSSRNHLWVFINCLIVNPTFDSQTKENMTLLQSKFGSKCALSPKFFTAVQKSGEKGEIRKGFFSSVWS